LAIYQGRRSDGTDAPRRVLRTAFRSRNPPSYLDFLADFRATSLKSSLSLCDEPSGRSKSGTCFLAFSLTALLGLSATFTCLCAIDVVLRLIANATAQSRFLGRKILLLPITAPLRLHMVAWAILSACAELRGA